MDTLKTLSCDISQKSLFIYEINYDSVIAFSALFFRKIKIEAFVTVYSKYEGESFLNVPVIGKQEAESKADDAILLIPDEFNMDKIQIKMECCSFSRIWTLNERLRKNNENYLYGAGNRGRELCLELEKQGVKIGGFCVSEKLPDLCSYMEKEVILPDQITNKKTNIIIAVYDEQMRKEMIRSCQEIGLENIYIDEFIQESVLKFNLFLQYLDIAVRQKKKILIYSEQKDSEAVMLRNVCRYMVFRWMDM